ncbi:MAG: glycosyl transferase family 2 [Planctomycetaceae bacterium]|nr:glycosyl transferase family 2 [Planctomycetaceae bacterium]
MPDVSVVLPVLNGARTIARAVRSILDQTLRGIELIVVDDGSTDETVAVVEAIRDPRLRLISCVHRGVAATTNTATEAVVAPLIARMDADDFAHPLRLEKQLQLLHERNYDVVGCQVRIVDEAGEVVPSMQRYERWINEETMGGETIAALRFVEFPLVNPTILARRRYFEMGFGEDDLPEDYDLMLRAAAAGMRFGKVGKVLFDWTDHPGRLTRTDGRYGLEAFMRCRRTHLLSGPLRDVGRVDLWGVGQTGKPWLRWLQAQGITVRRGYEVNERKVGKTIHGVRILHTTEMPDADGTPLVIAVGAEGGRASILPDVLSAGYVPGEDAWFVA